MRPRKPVFPSKKQTLAQARSGSAGSDVIGVRIIFREPFQGDGETKDTIELWRGYSVGQLDNCIAKLVVRSPLKAVNMIRGLSPRFEATRGNHHG